MKNDWKMLETAVNALSEKKGHDIVALDIRKLSVIADAFLIVTGDNARQVEALSDACEEAMGKAGYEKKNVEGLRGGKWVLLDYGDLIVHIFDRESRAFYDLERIWRDAETIDL